MIKPKFNLIKYIKGNVESNKEDIKQLLGMLFPYFELRKRAVDVYIKDIEKSNLSPETKAFCILNVQKLFKELKNQSSIVQVAIQNIKKDTLLDISSGVKEEWLDRFMDSAKFVSDDSLQLIWGRILAGEFDNPGSTPSSMIRILSEINSTYAKVFTNLCSLRRELIVLDENDNQILYDDHIICPLVSNDNPFFNEMGIDYETLQELDTIGLLAFDTNPGFDEVELPKGDKYIYICGILKQIIEEVDRVPVGSIILTDAGKCLRRIINIEPNPGIISIDEKYMNEENLHYLIPSNCKVVIGEDNMPKIIKK